MEFRPYYLAKAWVQYKHDVTIVGSAFSHLRIKQPITSSIVSKEHINGISYIWLSGVPYVGNGLMRAINIFQYILIAFFLLPFQLKHRFDVIITSSTYPLDIFPALLFKKLSKNTLLVYEPHDLWPMALTELGGMSSIHPFVLLNDVAEKISCISSDLILSMHPGNISHLSSRGAKPNNFYHIPNGVSLDDWDSTRTIKSSLCPTFQQLSNLKKPLIFYVGSISLANNLDFLLDSISLTKEKANYCIIGEGSELNHLKIKAKEKNLPVYFLGKIPKNEIPDTLSFADVCYVGFKPNPLYKYGMSANKLWDYMMAAKPIVMSISSCNDPVTEAGCGITVSSGKTCDLAKAIDYMLSHSVKERKSMGQLGKRYVLKNNSYSVLGKKCLDIFDNYIQHVN